jgi:preprotein translocase subunit SecD
MTRLAKQTILIAAVAAVSIYGVLSRGVRLGLDLRGGSSFILRVRTEDALAAQPTAPAARAAFERDVVEQTRRVLERRINAYGLSEASIQSYGSRGNELLVQLPDVRDAERIQQALQRRTVLEWYAVADGPYASADDARAQHGGVLPFGDKLASTAAPAAWYLLSGRPVIRGSDLRDARAAAGMNGQAITAFTLTQEAAVRFERFTQANLGRRTAILLDGQILSVPVIEDVIRDSGQIQGVRTRAEAEDLALNLRSGALPAGVEILQQQTVEPSLGADSIRSGMRAAAAGLAAVVLVMLLYYRRAGANATLALLLNGALLLAALAYFDAVLTLPGIAGVVLTIGMAVDSNVLIFERMREERRAGKNAYAAMAAGFKKAFATLVDTHVTTVVSCAFLFFFGTPPIRGFAITLALGLATNLFTSVFVSRVAFDWEFARASPRAVV